MEDPLPAAEPRRAAAAAGIGGGLVLVAGGRTPGGETTGAIDVYAPAAGRAFHLPASVALAVPRAHASAAILSGRRMVVVGGLGRDGAPIAAPELFFY